MTPAFVLKDKDIKEMISEKLLKISMNLLLLIYKI